MVRIARQRRGVGRKDDGGAFAFTAPRRIGLVQRCRGLNRLAAIRGGVLGEYLSAAGPVEYVRRWTGRSYRSLRCRWN